MVDSTININSINVCITKQIERMVSFRYHVIVRISRIVFIIVISTGCRLSYVDNLFDF